MMLLKHGRQQEQKIILSYGCKFLMQADLYEIKADDSLDAILEQVNQSVAAFSESENTSGSRSKSGADHGSPFWGLVASRIQYFWSCEASRAQLILANTFSKNLGPC